MEYHIFQIISSFDYQYQVLLHKQQDRYAYCIIHYSCSLYEHFLALVSCCTTATKQGEWILSHAFTRTCESSQPHIHSLSAVYASSLASVTLLEESGIYTLPFTTCSDRGEKVYHAFHGQWRSVSTYPHMLTEIFTILSITSCVIQTVQLL